MSFKRRVLSALGKDELLEIGRGLELDVTTRMGVDDLRDTLAKSKRANLAAIVQESLSRDTLKEICGALGLDDTGKEKAALVERILVASGGKGANGSGYKIDPAATRGRAREGAAPLGALLPGPNGPLVADTVRIDPEPRHPDGSDPDDPALRTRWSRRRRLRIQIQDPRPGHFCRAPPGHFSRVLGAQRPRASRR